MTAPPPLPSIENEPDFGGDRNARSAPPAPISGLRNSGIELLRILCIVLVLASHYSFFGGYPPCGWRDVSWSRFFIQSIGMFGSAACSVFVLITGYYSSTGTKPGHGLRVFPLAAETVFYSVAAYLSFCALGMSDFSFWVFLSRCFPFCGRYIWFVSNYIVFWFAIPFVNPMLAALSRRQFERLIAFFAVFWCLLPSFTAKGFLPGWTFGDLDMFFVMYAVGAYLRRFKPHERWTNRKIGLAAAVFFLAQVLSVAAFDLAAVLFRNDGFARHATHFVPYHSALSVPLAVSAFCFFQRLPFSNRTVNWIARSVLGIYVLHMQLTNLVWQRISPNAAHADSPYFHAVAKIGLLFLFCLFVDKIRHGAVRSFSRLHAGLPRRSSRV